MSKIVVYTAISNNYDTLKEPPDKFRHEADFVAFLDHIPRAASWQTRKVCSEFTDPCRNAKIHKILPHVFFPDATYSLWIDGSVEFNFTFPIRRLVDEYLKEHDLAVFKHPERHCIYEEAEVCIAQGKDVPAIIQRQMARYRKEHYPSGKGLAECTILLRRHTEKVRQFNEAWYEEIKNNSRRDQLSFDYAAYKTGLKICYFPNSLRQSPDDWFQVQPHAQEATARIEHRLQRRKSWANRLLRFFAILAFAWIPAEMMLIFNNAAWRPDFPVIRHTWPLTFLSLCGCGICQLWRLSLKRKIKVTKSSCRA
jgi:Protein of unknown function (DUF616)